MRMSHNSVVAAGSAAITQVLNAGITGVGPFKGAIEVAGEVLVSVGGDEVKAVDKLVRIHTRFAATTGAVTGLGGLLTLPVTMPAGIGGYYLVGARLAASVAHVRGHDVQSEDVRTAILMVMLGDAGRELVKELGIEIGTKGLAAAVKRVPGKVLIEINKRVGFRLVTKAGEKGVFNLGKLVPLIGAPIGGTIDGLAMRGVGRYARSAFPPAEAASM